MAKKTSVEQLNHYLRGELAAVETYRMALDDHSPRAAARAALAGCRLWSSAPYRTTRALRTAAADAAHAVPSQRLEVAARSLAPRPSSKSRPLPTFVDTTR